MSGQNIQLTGNSFRSLRHRKQPRTERNVKPLSATDVLAPTTMKNAAKCDTSCELQNLVSHQNFERNLRFLVKHVCWSVCFIPTEDILLYVQAPAVCDPS